MEVTVIGCSTSWTDRPASSYCINKSILVDVGSGTNKFYAKSNIDMMNIKTIFLTHLHSDHTASLSVYFGKYLRYSPQKEKITIYGPKGLKVYLKHLLYVCLMDYYDVNLEDYFNLIEIDNFDNKITLNQFTISTYSFDHGNMKDIAYIFDDGQTKVGFSGDLNMQQNIDKFIENTNNVFLECCSMESSKAHLGYNDYIKFQNQFPDKKFYAIHCTDEVYNNEKQLGITCAKHSKTYKF